MPSPYGLANRSTVVAPDCQSTDEPGLVDPILGRACTPTPMKPPTNEPATAPSSTAAMRRSRRPGRESSGQVQIRAESGVARHGQGPRPPGRRARRVALPPKRWSSPRTTAMPGRGAHRPGEARQRQSWPSAASATSPATTPHSTAVSWPTTPPPASSACDVEESICRIAQMALAVGIHLAIATPRPRSTSSSPTPRPAGPCAVRASPTKPVILDQPRAQRLLDGEVASDAGAGQLRRSGQQRHGWSRCVARRR